MQKTIWHANDYMQKQFDFLIYYLDLLKTKNTKDKGLLNAKDAKNKLQKMQLYEDLMKYTKDAIICKT